jgi:hypothetical protein
MSPSTDHSHPKEASGGLSPPPRDSENPGKVTRFAWRGVGAIVAALAGIAFFFVIVGVFGLPASMAALALFLTLAVLIFRRSTNERTAS